MEQEKIDKIIEFLQQVKKRPQMYIESNDDTEKTHIFLWGIMLGVILSLNLDFSDCISNRGKATNKRGLEYNALGIAKELTGKGYDNSQIVIEQIEIEIEMWKIFRDSFEK
jgi:hypothetical protein